MLSVTFPWPVAFVPLWREKCFYLYPTLLMATRILIVEDNEIERELILEHLSREADFEVIAIASDGSEALAWRSATARMSC